VKPYWKQSLLLMSVGYSTLLAQAATNEFFPLSNKIPASAAARVQTNIQQIAPGLVQIGDVKIDKKQRTVSFPAVLNLKYGAMEYLLVSSWGKVHESILRTDSEPYRIHVGMLLLGAKGAEASEEEMIQDPVPFVTEPSEMRVPGDKISVEVRWKSNGKENKRRAEELVYNIQKKAKLPRGRWVYNGSYMIESTFVAQREGSTISLITDPEALINYDGPGHDNDSIWIANTNRLPPSDVPLEIIIKLPRQKAKR
jgi:hypothetical protein